MLVDTSSLTATAMPLFKLLIPSGATDVKSWLFFSRMRRLGLLFLLPLAFCPSVQAAEHGEGGAGAPAPMQFTVNVGQTLEDLRILMVSIVLEYATPEVAQRFTAIKPKLQHRIILLLSGETPGNLLSSKGKQELQERIAKDLNSQLDEDAKTGITEVLFTDFIVQ